VMWKKIETFGKAAEVSSPCLVASRNHRVPIVAQYISEWEDEENEEGWYSVDGEDYCPLGFIPEYWSYAPILPKDMDL